MRTNQWLTLLPDLAVLVHVVEAGSFSAAARRLATTPSAISRQVARLEAALGLRVLERTTRSLRLTEGGAEVHRHAREMLRAALAAGEVSGGTPEAPRGLLRVSAPKALARQVIHPLVPPFLARFPDVDVQLMLTDGDTDLIRDGVDLAVRITDAPPPGLAARRLMTVRQGLYASPAYLARQGTPDHPMALAGHQCIYLGETADDNLWRFRRGGETAQVRVRGRYVANHTEVRREGIEAGLGIGSLPDFAARAALEAGRIAPVLADWHLETAYQGGVWILYLPGAHPSPKARAFIDHLVAQLA
ncbi:MAG: LysR family transcriptional regulator [Rhodocyclaceae bacterium]|nr:LysR family transcriptional regulator [Rhodocyclaceae bacterium]